MGEIGGFKKFNRADPPERVPGERVGDHREFVRTLPLVELRDQGARCMECGVPFCHHGCPLGNLIPDWNDLVYRDRFREAIDQLHRTNNFPEFTGRLCPAPCEAACVLEIEEGNAVTIKQIELAIVDRAWDEGWIVAEPPAARTGRTRRGRRLGTGRSRVRAAAEPRRAHRDRVRARRGRRRPRPLRHPRLQDREARRRAAPRAARRGGRRVPLRRRCRQRRGRVGAARELRRRRARRRLARAARPAGARAASSPACTSRWSTSTGGTATSAARPSPTISAAGQARDRHRRRRHRRRLRRERAPRGRRVGDADRAARRAAGAPLGRV